MKFIFAAFLVCAVLTSSFVTDNICTPPSGPGSDIPSSHSPSSAKQSLPPTDSFSVSPVPLALPVFRSVGRIRIDRCTGCFQSLIFISRARGPKLITGKPVHQSTELTAVCKSWRRRGRSESRMLDTLLPDRATLFPVTFCWVTVCWGWGRETESTVLWQSHYQRVFHLPRFRCTANPTSHFWCQETWRRRDQILYSEGAAPVRALLLRHD